MADDQPLARHRRRAPRRAPDRRSARGARRLELRARGLRRRGRGDEAAIPERTERIGRGPSRAVVGRRHRRGDALVDGVERLLAYSALIPPWTNKVSPILTMAGLRVAHWPSSPDGLHASLCSTQPSGCSAIQAARTCSGVILRVLRPVGGFELRAVGFVDAVAARGRLAVGEGGIFARRRVAVVAEQVHRLVVAEDDDRPCRRARGASRCSCCRLRTIFSESGSRSVMSPSWTRMVLPPAQWPLASMSPAPRAMSCHALKSPWRSPTATIRCGGCGERAARHAKPAPQAPERRCGRSA